MIGDPESRSKQREQSRHVVREGEARKWEIITGIFIALCILATIGWRAIRECRRRQQLEHFCSIGDVWTGLASGADPMFWIYAGVMMAIACAVIVLAIRGKLS
jgi:hypothetical protein